MKMKLSDLVDAFMMTDGYDNETFICSRTGKIYYRSDYVDPDDPPPDDLDEEEKYLAIPSQHQLHPGRSLALDFTRDDLPDDLDDVYDFFRRKGRFRPVQIATGAKGRSNNGTRMKKKDRSARCGTGARKTG